MDASSSSAEDPSLHKHDVFLSFRGEDTRHNFTSHLYAALCQKQIRTYIDEISLEKGDTISPMLPKRIEESAISIVVFSENYAASHWCLEELVCTLKCSKEKGLIVLPIFLGIDPSHVRNQKGSYASCFQKLERRFNNNTVKVQECRQALTEAASISGWDSRVKSEARIIEEVVDDIMKKKITINLKISIYPIGYDDCDKYLKLFLQMGLDDVFVVGIVGESKMGKTMIAKAVYDEISPAFDGSSFLKGIGQRSKEPNGLVQLQEKLLRDVLKRKDIKIDSIIRGLEMIKENLFHKRALLVLDDVNDLELLSTLVGSREWFGLESKIIITTRSLPLLQIYGVDQIIMAQGLPVPLDILEIWEPYRQTGRRIAGLKQYIQSFCYLTNEKVRDLEDSLLRERQKSAIQAQRICQLENCKGGEVGSK